MKQLRIYVAGPYTPSNCDLHDAARVANANVNKAITIANAIFKKGHYAFVPHLSHYTHIHESNHCKAPKEFWYEYDNTFLEKWANAFFYIGASNGANMERALAQKLGYPVFLSLDDVPDLNRCKFLVDKEEGVFDRW
jgi:hypothetical protein